MHGLLSDSLLFWKEAILASYPFLDSLLLREWQGYTLHFRTCDPRSKKNHAQNDWAATNPSIYIIFSFQFTTNSILPDAKPQFASKISSLDVSNDLRTYSPRRTTVENRLWILQANCGLASVWVGSELQWNCSIVLGFCVRFVAARLFWAWIFLLFGSGVRKWSVQPCPSLRSSKPRNSLRQKWPQDNRCNYSKERAG